MSMFQQTVLAAEGLALAEKSLMDFEGMRKLTESKMEGQAMLPLRALIRKTASRCLLLTWRGRKFNVTRMSSCFMCSSSFSAYSSPIMSYSWFFSGFPANFVIYCCMKQRTFREADSR
jgi:hypothetical protein